MSYFPREILDLVRDGEEVVEGSESHFGLRGVGLGGDTVGWTGQTEPGIEEVREIGNRKGRQDPSPDQSQDLKWSVKDKNRDHYSSLHIRGFKYTTLGVIESCTDINFCPGDFSISILLRR